MVENFSFLKLLKLQFKKKKKEFLLQLEKNHKLEFLFVAYSRSFIAYFMKQVAKENSLEIFLILGIEDTLYISLKDS